MRLGGPGSGEVRNCCHGKNQAPPRFISASWEKQCLLEEENSLSAQTTAADHMRLEKEKNPCPTGRRKKTVLEPGHWSLLLLRGGQGHEGPTP